MRGRTQAARAGDLDGDPRGAGPRDVLCQHILIAACAGPFEAGALYAEITQAGAYRGLARAEFDRRARILRDGGVQLARL